MDKITRYLILILIIVVFVILAPLIVLYVSGTSFDFDDKISGETGILDVQSDPTDAEVYLNGEKIDNTPTTERFVERGTYSVEVKMDGYYTWQKNLFIESGQVTYAGALGDRIKLLAKSEPNQVDTQITAVAQRDNQLIYVKSDGTAVIFDSNNNKVIKEQKLAQQISKLKDVVNSNYLLANSSRNENFLLNTNSLELLSLPTEIKTAASIEVSNDNIIFAKVAEKLLAYDLESKQLYTALDKDVLGFTLNNNMLYVASKTSNKTVQTYYWDEQTLIPQSILISQELPKAKNYQLFLTNHKELFLLADQNLFRVNQQLDLINDQVTYVNLNRYRSQLTFGTRTEIFYYNFISNQAELFYRTTEQVNFAIVSPELGYGFIATDQKLTAIEIDNRNGQNTYTLIDSGGISELMLSYDETNLTIIHNNNLFALLVNK